MRRIRKCWLEGAEVALVGERVDLTYPYAHVGEGAGALAEESRADKLKAALSASEVARWGSPAVKAARLEELEAVVTASVSLAGRAGSP